MNLHEIFLLEGITWKMFVLILSQFAGVSLKVYFDDRKAKGALAASILAMFISTLLLFYFAR